MAAESLGLPPLQPWCKVYLIDAWMHAAMQGAGVVAAPAGRGFVFQSGHDGESAGGTPGCGGSVECSACAGQSGAAVQPHRAADLRVPGPAGPVCSAPGSPGGTLGCTVCCRYSSGTARLLLLLGLALMAPVQAVGFLRGCGNALLLLAHAAAPSAELCLWKCLSMLDCLPCLLPVGFHHK